VFSNTPISPRPIWRRTKLWGWVDDPIIRKLFEQLGVNAVPLACDDAAVAADRADNACYGSPLSPLALQ